MYIAPTGTVSFKPIAMIKNYFRVGIRNLRKNKSYILINTFGLGISLACCIAAYIFIAYNIEFDNFHQSEKVEKTFAVHNHVKRKDGNTQITVTAPMVLAPLAAQEISGIERFTRYVSDGGYMRYGDNAFSERIAFADSTFFQMFDYPLLKGNHQSFKNKYSIFINEELAKKYFPDEDPLGKLLVLNFPNNKEIEVIVGGVMAKVPLNNTFVFDAMMRIENYLDIYSLGLDNWSDWRDPATYFELTSTENAGLIGKQLDKYIPIRNEVKTDVVVQAYTLEAFKAGFDEDEIDAWWTNARLSSVPLIVFTSMAVLILLIACFNLTNTSIAITSQRLKEVGVRKAIGAARSQIVIQFLFETTVTIILSLLVGLLMAQLIVPAFTDMWQIPYGMKDLNGLNLFVSLLFLVFLTSLLAGIYPALFNSKFNPVTLLKGSVKINGTNALTRTLVTLQFALSVIVLIAGVVFIQNTTYQEQIKFGYDKERVIVVRIQNENEFKAMEAEAIRNPKILNVAVSDHHVGYNTYMFPVEVDTGEYQARLLGVGKNYFETMGFAFAEGRPFNLDNASDQAEAVIVNKAFLKKTGLENALDKVITVHGSRRYIVGIMENHIDNLYSSKEPEAMVFYPAEAGVFKTMLVRTEPGDLAEIQKFLEATWKRLFPTKPFESQFQEDVALQNTKRLNANLEKIFLFLTVLGGLLSASGIFALASLNIAKRTKEIGIRKALGATIGNIVQLLNKEFVIILLVAVVLGSAGGYFLTDALLSEIYAYRIAIGTGIIILCSAAIFVVGILTTSTTILKAAKANPVDTLRDE